MSRLCVSDTVHTAQGLMKRILLAQWHREQQLQLKSPSVRNLLLLLQCRVLLILLGFHVGFCHSQSLVIWEDRKPLIAIKYDIQELL